MKFAGLRKGESFYRESRCFTGIPRVPACRFPGFHVPRKYTCRANVRVLLKTVLKHNDNTYVPSAGENKKKKKSLNGFPPVYFPGRSALRRVGPPLKRARRPRGRGVGGVRTRCRTAAA